MDKIQLTDEAAATIVEAHFKPTEASINLLRNEFVATVGEGVWHFPEPTVRVNEVLKVSPIDWENDELAIARLFYLLNNRTDKEKLGAFTNGEDVMQFVWPSDEELLEVKIDKKLFADLTSTELHEIYCGWKLALDAQAKAQVADMIEQKFNLNAPDIAETVWAFADALGKTVDEILNMTYAQLLTLISGSESAVKRFKKKMKKRGRT